MINRLGGIPAVIVVVLFGVTIILCPLLGSVDINLISIWNIIYYGDYDRNSTDFFILWSYRLPRVIFALLGGGSLALTGLVFQSLLRNPLATPFTLGLSSAASFGAIFALKRGSLTGISFSLLPSGFAFITCLLCMVLLFAFNVRRSGLDISTLLLSGVALSFLFSSAILFLLYFSGPIEHFQMLKWIIGGISSISYQQLIYLSLILLVVSIYFFWISRQLNLLNLGTEFAESHGVKSKQLQLISFVAGALLIAIIISISGPIGFVGLMVPHIARLLFGSNFVRLIPMVLLMGGILLAWSDLLARVILAPTQIPVGIITAFLGAPFFLWLLISSRRGRSGLL